MPTGECGEEGDGAAKLPKARTRGAMCLVARVWIWSGCARAPSQARQSLVPRLPPTLPTVGTGRAGPGDVVAILATCGDRRKSLPSWSFTLPPMTEVYSPWPTSRVTFVS
jgi:hypothetical protein